MYVESSSSLTIYYIGCDNVYIFSSHNWVMVFEIVINSLILEMWNYMSNPSATASALFDSSPFGTC